MIVYKNKPNVISYTFYFLLFGFLLTFPFDEFSAVSNIAMILLTAISIFSAGKNFNVKIIRQNIWICFYVVFYFIHVISYLNSSNKGMALFEIQQKVSILFFPIIFLCFPQKKKKIIHLYYVLYIVVMALYSFICIGYAIAKNYHFNLLETIKLEYFSYQTFASPFKMDAVFMAMYICLALYLLVYLIGQYWTRLNTLQKTFCFLACAYFFVLILMLSSRMQILTLLSTAFLWILYLAYLRKKLLQGLLLCVLLMASAVTIVLVNPSLKVRFQKAFNFNRSIKLDKKKDYSLGQNWDGSKLRIAQWTCAIDLIKRNWLFGVGTGDAQDELQKTYEEFKFYFASRYNRYNAHNQYLETWISVGVFGIVLLLIIYLQLFYAGFKRKDLVLVAFAFLILFSSLTESILMRRQGIMFLMFFASFFLSQPNNSENLQS